MAHRPRSRAIIATLATPLIAVGLLSAAPAAAQEPGDLSAKGGPSVAGTVDGAKSLSSRLAQTDEALLARSDGAAVPVIVKLDQDALASYTGGIEDLAATSPSVTGRALNGASAAEQEYETYLSANEDAVISQLVATVPNVRIGERLRTVYGGFAAIIPANAVESVLAIPGVVAVQRDAELTILTDASPEFVNAPPVYDILGTTANAGEGIIYGNLDTGIWPEHASFADLGNLKPPPGPARECNYGDNPLTPASDPFVCNNKLIGGAHFTDAYDMVHSSPTDPQRDPFAGTARDHDGHGTHTSSTAGGNIVDSAPVFGVERGPIHGLAPGAWVMEYKVCGPLNCISSDSMRAVGQAILDGVDVINFSISGGTTPFTDPVELAFLDAYAAGVFVSTSSGNEGPGAGTANHLSPWTTSVGASTQTREFATTLSLTASNGDTFTTDGASITAGVATLPVVLSSAAPYSRPLCDAPAPAGLFTGKIVACQRGGNARTDKGFNVLQGGAAGHILYNPTLADVETDNHWLPTIHLADGTDFVAFMNSHAGVTGSFPDAVKRDGQGDVMAAFSSRGPGGLFIKPDLTAPGVQILAGDSPLAGDPADGGGPAGNEYQAIAGTSMSSPHVAGAAILARAVHPDWTPGQVRSALMTTAITEVVKEDLTTPADAFDMGAGRIDVGESVGAPVTLDETAANFAALGNDPVNAVHLNIPSINAPVMSGRLVTTRVLTNASGRTERFQTSGETSVGSTITITPRRVVLRPFETATITITIESQAPVGAQQFGTIHLESNRGADLHLPVAFIHTQGSVNLTQACAPATVARGGQSLCTVQAANNSFDEQIVDLDTFVEQGARIVGTSGADLVSPRQAQRHDVALAGTAPGVPSVDPGASPGYVSLDLFGGTLRAPVGDEQIVNLNGFGAFDYNGQMWDVVGVDSNGYLVVGGGSSEDNECCNLPDGADPAAPNNILAPFWTDLDGTGAPGILANILANAAGDAWLVVEWRVNVFGTTDQRRFQVWLGLNDDTNPGQDITYAYSAPQTDPAGQPFLVGAENIRGEGDVVAVLPTVDLRVTSTDLVPGDVASYSVTVRGQQPGLREVRSEMTASLLPGVTIVRSQIRVLP